MKRINRPSTKLNLITRSTILPMSYAAADGDGMDQLQTPWNLNGTLVVDQKSNGTP
ncbi:hypothetical protein Tco_0746447, partial [Tanacetum coccineum]